MSNGPKTPHRQFALYQSVVLLSDAVCLSMNIYRTFYDGQIDFIPQMASRGNKEVAKHPRVLFAGVPLELSVAVDLVQQLRSVVYRTSQSSIHAELGRIEISKSAMALCET